MKIFWPYFPSPGPSRSSPPSPAQKANDNLMQQQTTPNQESKLKPQLKKNKNKQKKHFCYFYRFFKTVKIKFYALVKVNFPFEEARRGCFPLTPKVGKIKRKKNPQDINQANIPLVIHTQLQELKI